MNEREEEKKYFFFKTHSTEIGEWTELLQQVVYYLMNAQTAKCNMELMWL